MGVRDLTTFAECHPDVFKPVELSSLVEEYRDRQLPGPRPTLLVDTGCWRRHLYLGLDDVCGGQGHEFVARTRAMLAYFDHLNVDLIFVHQTMVREEERMKNWPRRFRETRALLAMVEGGLIPLVVHGEASERPDSTFRPAAKPLSILENFFHRNVVRTNQDSNRIMYDFARDPEKNVFGILTRNSDFLIFPNPPSVRILSVKSFNLSCVPEPGEPWHVMEYDRGALARLLGLHTEQLPLFAALRADGALSPFHRRLLGNQFYRTWTLFFALGKFIARERLSGEFEKVEDQLRKWPDLFGDPSVVSSILTSVKKYSCVNDGAIRDAAKDEPNSDDWTGLLKMFKDNSFLKKIMTDRAITKVPDKKLSSDVDIPSVLDCFEKVRQRGYGVILLEKPDAFDSQSKKFLVGMRELRVEKSAEEDEFQLCHVYQHIETPPDCHPGLKDLMKSNAEGIKDISWKLFSHVVSPKINPSSLRSLNKEFLCPVVQMIMLQNEFKFPVLYEWEVNLILVIHARLLKMDPNQIRKLKLDAKKLSSRGLQIAALYTDCFISEMVYLFPATGIHYGNISPLLNFNGLYFQSQYQKFLESKSFDGIATPIELEEVKCYFDLITFQGEKVHDRFTT